MRFRKPLVIAVLSAVVLAGCASKKSVEPKPEGKISATQPADQTSGRDAQAVADALGDYFHALVLHVDELMAKYGDTADGTVVKKSDLDSMFADAITHVDMESFTSEKYAYATIVSNAAMMMMVSFGAEAADDLRKDLSKVTVTGDRATVSADAFLPPVQTTEGYVDEFVEVRNVLKPQLVRKNGSWLIDGSAIDDAYFEAWGMSLSEFNLE